MTEKYYECYIPEMLRYCYVQANSREEAERKAEEQYKLLVVCEETEQLPPYIRPEQVIR